MIAPMLRDLLREALPFLHAHAEEYHVPQSLIDRIEKAIDPPASPLLDAIFLKAAKRESVEPDMSLLVKEKDRVLATLTEREREVLELRFKTSAKPPCRPSWFMELARKFIDQFDPHEVTPGTEELLANELDDAYLRGRREEREVLELRFKTSAKPPCRPKPTMTNRELEEFDVSKLAKDWLKNITLLKTQLKTPLGLTDLEQPEEQAKIYEFNECAECPFMERKWGDGPSYCGHPDAPESSSDPNDGNVEGLDTPPKFCPLRVQPTLVQLVEKNR